MVDADDVRTAGRDNIADQAQLAGLVLQRDHQVRLAPAHNKAAGDDAGQNVHVDVAAGNQADRFLARQRQLAEQCGGHRRGTCALGDELLVLHQRQNGRGDLVLADRNDLVHVLADHVERRLAGRLDRNAVGKGHGAVQRFIFVVVEGVLHAGRTRGLHAVDLYLRAQALDGERHAGDQTAAADRHDDRVHIGQLVEDFETNRSLPCDDQLVIIRMNEGHAGLLLQLHGAVMRVVVGALDQLDLGTEALCALYLHNRGTVRHTDNAFDAHTGRGQCHALRMVARRAGNDALRALLRGQLADFVVRAADLEAACNLQVFGFQVQIGAGAQACGGDQVGLAGNLLQDELGMVDFIQCKHGLFPLCLTIVGPDPGLPDRAGPRRCGQDTDMSIVEIC